MDARVGRTPQPLSDSSASQIFAETDEAEDRESIESERSTKQSSCSCMPTADMLSRLSCLGNVKPRGILLTLLPCLPLLVLDESLAQLSDS